MPQFARLFRIGSVADRNACGWFSVNILGPMARHEAETYARANAQWRKPKNLWPRGTAGVAFVNVAKRRDKNFPSFTDMLRVVCAATVQNPERYAQTGPGWVVRELELGRVEAEQVFHFIGDNLSSFSADGLHHAPEKMPAQTRNRLTCLYQAS